MEGAEIIGIEKAEPRTVEAVKADMLDMLISRDRWLASWQQRMQALNEELAEVQANDQGD